MPHAGHIELYPDEKGEQRWRIRAANGKVLADSAEGYTDPSDAHDGLAALATQHPAAALRIGLMLHSWPATH
jgi:uncharacterized protein YegP (UPF0339 family)